MVKYFFLGKREKNGLYFTLKGLQFSHGLIINFVYQFLIATLVVGVVDLLVEWLKLS